VPAFCQVHGALAPTPHSNIQFEVWLPAASWNGKLQVVGNGGLAGTISYPALATAVRDGRRATRSTAPSTAWSAIRRDVTSIPRSFSARAPIRPRV
jgi:Tannase and feruloyl esterase